MKINESLLIFSFFGKNFSLFPREPRFHCLNSFSNILNGEIPLLPLSPLGIRVTTSTRSTSGRYGRGSDCPALRNPRLNTHRPEFSSGLNKGKPMKVYQVSEERGARWCSTAALTRTARIRESMRSSSRSENSANLTYEQKKGKRGFLHNNHNFFVETVESMDAVQST